jgi:hypothetical protein
MKELGGQAAAYDPWVLLEELLLGALWAPMLGARTGEHFWVVDHVAELAEGFLAPRKGHDIWYRYVGSVYLFQEVRA